MSGDVVALRSSPGRDAWTEGSSQRLLLMAVSARLSGEVRFGEVTKQSLGAPNAAAVTGKLEAR